MCQSQITQTRRKRKPNPLPAGKAAGMRVGTVPDRRFVDPLSYESASIYR
jgi:hypothetical protein